jgi:hypothetical protein
MGDYATSEKAALLTYGFLASRISSIISSFLKHPAPLKDQEQFIVSEARKFVEDIITGQKLVSGKTEGLSPTPRSIESYNYAIETLEKMEVENSVNGEIDAKSSKDIEKVFESFRLELEYLQKYPQKSDDKNKEKLELTRLFFFFVSKSLIYRAQEIFEKRVTTPRYA